MRKCLVLSVAFLLCFLLLQSCSNREAADPCATENTIGQIDPSQSFVSENLVLFQAYVQDNPIDLAYASERQPDTMQDMIIQEQRYADIWLNELEYSCSVFANGLGEEEKLEFLHIHDQWKENLTDSVGLLPDLVGKTVYQELGTEYRLECAAYYRKQIRERTLYIKYITFCAGGEVDFQWTD